MLGFDEGKVREILGLQSHVQIPALVAFGHPAEDGYPQYRLPVESVTRLIA
jgi:nitroreductase